MKKKAKQVIVLSIGGIFLLLGSLGLVLPFLQGFLFIAIGLILLSFYSPKIRSRIEKHTQKYPHLSLVVKKIEIFLAKIIGEI